MQFSQHELFAEAWQTGRIGATHNGQYSPSYEDITKSLGGAENCAEQEREDSNPAALLPGPTRPQRSRMGFGPCGIICHFGGTC